MAQGAIATSWWHCAMWIGLGIAKRLYTTCIFSRLRSHVTPANRLLSEVPNGPLPISTCLSSCSLHYSSWSKSMVQLYCTDIYIYRTATTSASLFS